MILQFVVYLYFKKTKFKTLLIFFSFGNSNMNFASLKYETSPSNER